MTATATARESKRKDGEVISYPMAAVKIPKGALVNISAAGYATNATDASGETFAGVAYETVDNSAGSAGALSIRVETSGTFVFVDGGGNGAQTDVGVEFKVVDNQTVTDASTTNNLKAGIAVESISATSVRIRIDRYAS
jgi:3D (Asp-Asp-Asp) domain-containing protein